MIYTQKDIKFDQLSPTAFERLCFDLLSRLGYRKLIWRQGGADQGRDIEGSFTIHSPLMEQETKWFFECKHYQNGVPPEVLNSKIAWADAQQPDYLVMLLSSYPTNSAREWLEKIPIQKNYKIIVIEGTELEMQLLNYPDLIEVHFSISTYERLLLDIKRHYIVSHIIPSFDQLSKIAAHIDAERLSLNDIGFLFTSLYRQYRYDFEKDDYYGYLNPDALKPLYARLAALSSTAPVALFGPYQSGYEMMSGSGFWDDLEQWIPGYESESRAQYQFNMLHLNASGPTSTWLMGYYLFFKSKDGPAFELFCIPNTEFTTTARIYPQVNLATIDQLSLKPSKTFRKALRKFALVFQ